MAQILVVEDEPALLDVVKTLLTSNGHTVLTEFDGVAGLEAARREHPALIIADQMLPMMTGLDLCHALKAEKLEPPIPFLLMTGGNVPVQDSCPDAILRKPFSIEELERVTNALLATRAPSFFG